MKVTVVTLDNAKSGELELDDAVFAVSTRADILQRVVEWQRAKARAGTHKTRGRNEISGTTRKQFKQKGTGRARQGTHRATQHRGGARVHGPVVRDHGYSLPKKIRALGMKMALSAKQASGKLTIIDEAKAADAKTAIIAKQFAALNLTKPLIIGGAQLDEAFAKSARNIKGVDVLPLAGANVYDILRHKELVLTKEAVEGLQARLSV
jgi:large subunit ribosomal protein L4